MLDVPSRASACRQSPVNARPAGTVLINGGRSSKTLGIKSAGAPASMLAQSIGHLQDIIRTAPCARRTVEGDGAAHSTPAPRPASASSRCSVCSPSSRPTCAASDRLRASPRQRPRAAPRVGLFDRRGKGAQTEGPGVGTTEIAKAFNVVGLLWGCGPCHVLCSGARKADLGTTELALGTGGYFVNPFFERHPQAAPRHRQRDFGAACAPANTRHLGHFEA
jgi:hypothetical protein